MANYHILNASANNGDIMMDFTWEMRIVGIDQIVPNCTEADLWSRVRSASIPAVSSVNKITSEFMTTKQYFAGKKEITSTMRLNFEETENMKVYDTFRTWLELIQNVDHTSARGGNGALINSKRGTDGYSRSMILLLKQRDGTITKTIELFNAWPTSLSEPSLSYETQGGAIKFDVEFSYDDYTQR